MSALIIETKDGRNAFLPGDTLQGQIQWELEKPETRLILSLFWWIDYGKEGKIEIIEEMPIPRPNQEGAQSFQFQLPIGPYSFDGNLFQVKWSLELVANNNDIVERIDFTVSPTMETIKA